MDDVEFSLLATDTVATKNQLKLGMYSKSRFEEDYRIRKRNFRPRRRSTPMSAQETSLMLVHRRRLRYWSSRRNDSALAVFVWSIAVKSIERTWSSNRQVPALQHPHVRETGNDKVNAARCNSTPCSIHVLPRFLVLALAKCANIPPLATDRDEVDLRLSPDIHPVIFPFPLHQETTNSESRIRERESKAGVGRGNAIAPRRGRRDDPTRTLQRSQRTGRRNIWGLFGNSLACFDNSEWIRATHQIRSGPEQCPGSPRRTVPIIHISATMDDRKRDGIAVTRSDVPELRVTTRRNIPRGPVQHCPTCLPTRSRRPNWTRQPTRRRSRSTRMNTVNRSPRSALTRSTSIPRG